jgi:hypothetical protein
VVGVETQITSIDEGYKIDFFLAFLLIGPRPISIVVATPTGLNSKFVHLMTD